MKKVYSHYTLTDFLNSEEHKLQDDMTAITQGEGPSEWSLRKILGFSASLKIERSKSLGLIERFQN